MFSVIGTLKANPPLYFPLQVTVPHNAFTVLVFILSRKTIRQANSGNYGWLVPYYAAYSFSMLHCFADIILLCYIDFVKFIKGSVLDYGVVYELD